MNPSGQPQPGQNNLPPNQPPVGSPPPQAGGWQQPQQTGDWSQAPSQNPWQQQTPQQGWNQPANSYAQPQQGIAPQPAGPPQYSADYLDQIAPGAGGPKLLSGSFTWIIIGLAVIFMFAVGIIALSGNGNNTATAQTSYLRIGNLITITDNYRRFLKSSSLSRTNTNFKIFLTGAETNLVDPLAKNGIATNKLDKETKDKEKSIASDITSRLEDARLNAILDRVYAREMAYQAQLLLDNYTKMSKNASPDIANNAKNAIPNLQPIQKAFADFKGTED